MPCDYSIAPGLERRQANALCIEIGQPAIRCKLKTPEHWPDGMVTRWLWSGGSPLVFGMCDHDCPLKSKD